MLCEQCKKREATVKYVEVVNGVKTEHNLCGHCAAKLDIGQFSAVFEGELSLASLLSGLLGIQDTEKKDEKLAGITCPTCKTTYEDFIEGSRFGCADCYSVFGPLIGEKIRHLQGSETHVGKRPVHLQPVQVPENIGEQNPIPMDEPSKETVRELTKEEQIRLLQARLKDALRHEDYAEAAAIRDEVRELKAEEKET